MKISEYQYFKTSKLWVARSNRAGITGLETSFGQCRRTFRFVSEAVAVFSSVGWYIP